VKRLFFIVAVLAAGSAMVPITVPAAEGVSTDSIICALDPNCTKPQSRMRSLRRGVKSEGVEREESLSVNLYVNFAYNSADLTSDARITLDGLGSALGDQRLAGFSFVIAGHTDAKGGAEFNQKLSERRAETVRNYMVTKFGIDPGRLTAKGYGKSELLDPSQPEDGVNRRVQIINATAGGRRN
jgi:outer membrane protein OmpA-like peptidoglycan-associated protein